MLLLDNKLPLEHETEALKDKLRNALSKSSSDDEEEGSEADVMLEIVDSYRGLIPLWGHIMKNKFRERYDK